VVESAVTGAGEPVPDLLAGGGIDGCGAVVGGEVMPAGKPVDGLDFGQDPPGDEGTDAVEIGQLGAGLLDQRGDLIADGVHLRVQCPGVV
jgi:hypothetical protein